MIHTQVGRNCDGLIHHEFLPSNRTINGQFYTEIFYQLRKRIRTVRPYFPQNVSWLLLHDNARPHNALPVRIFLAQHGIIEMQHPPYSPDLVPADFFLYSKLKNSLKGTRFQDFEAFKKTVTALLVSVPIFKEVVYFDSPCTIVVNRKIFREIFFSDYNFNAPNSTVSGCDVSSIIVISVSKL